MEALIDLSWRVYPAAFLIVLGLSVGLRGGWRCPSQRYWMGVF